MIIVLVLVLRGKSLPIRGTVEETRLPLAPYPKRIWQWSLVGIGAVRRAGLRPARRIPVQRLRQHLDRGGQHRPDHLDGDAQLRGAHRLRRADLHRPDVDGRRGRVHHHPAHGQRRGHPVATVPGERPRLAMATGGGGRRSRRHRRRHHRRVCPPCASAACSSPW